MNESNILPETVLTGEFSIPVSSQQLFEEALAIKGSSKHHPSSTFPTPNPFIFKPRAKTTLTQASAL